MYEIPTSVILNDTEYQIRDNGDYRIILDCFGALGDADLTERERLFSSLIIFYEDINSIADISKLDIEQAVKQMYWFFNCGSENPVGVKTNYRLLDWETDSQIISSAVNKIAGKEIRSIEYLHWWTFMGYYSSVGESTLSTVIRIREKIVKNKKLDKGERQFRLDNPGYFNWNRQTLEEQELDRIAHEIWNGGMNSGGV